MTDNAKNIPNAIIELRDGSYKLANTHYGSLENVIVLFMQSAEKEYADIDTRIRSCFRTIG